MFYIDYEVVHAQCEAVSNYPPGVYSVYTSDVYTAPISSEVSGGPVSVVPHHTRIIIVVTILLSSAANMTGMVVLTLYMMVVGYPVPSLSTSANFCPVEGADYLDRPDGNIIKVKSAVPPPHTFTSLVPSCV